MRSLSEVEIKALALFLGHLLSLNLGIGFGQVVVVQNHFGDRKPADLKWIGRYVPDRRASVFGEFGENEALEGKRELQRVLADPNRERKRIPGLNLDGVIKGYLLAWCDFRTGNLIRETVPILNQATAALLSTEPDYRLSRRYIAIRPDNFRDSYLLTALNLDPLLSSKLPAEQRWRLDEYKIHLQGLGWTSAAVYLMAADRANSSSIQGPHGAREILGRACARFPDLKILPAMAAIYWASGLESMTDPQGRVHVYKDSVPDVDRALAILAAAEKRWPRYGLLRVLDVGFSLSAGDEERERKQLKIASSCDLDVQDAAFVQKERKRLGI